LAEWQAYSRAEVSEPVSKQMEAHLEQCPVCEETLRVCAEGTDPVVAALVATVRDAPRNQLPVEELVSPRVLERIRRMEFDSSHDRNRVEEPPLPLGTMLGAYRLEELIGVGGMGAVYRAVHTNLDKTVAVKVLPADRLRNPAAIARFRREMKLIGQLDHPHVVRASDANEQSGMHYLVMEYLDGVDLSRLVRCVGPLPVAAACELVRQAAVGLQAIHEQRLVHRDLKPSNLMVSRSGVVNVLDLGLALLERTSGDVSEMTSTGLVMGTVDYMAPEQADDSHSVDIRADIYSLGATLFKLLTGRAPYERSNDDTPIRRLKYMLTAPVPEIRDARPDVPPELASLLRRLLSKTPEQRPSQPHEVAELLRPFTQGVDFGAVWSAFDIRRSDPASFTDGQSPFAIPQSSSVPPRRWRRWVAITLCGSLLILLSLFLTFRTRYGTVTVRAPKDLPPDVTIALKRGDEVHVASQQNGWSVRVKEGRWHVESQGTTDGVSVDKDSLTVTRDKSEVVTVGIRREPALPLTASSPTKSDPMETEDVFTTTEIWEPGPEGESIPGLIHRPARLTGIYRWQVMCWALLGDFMYEPRMQLSPNGRFWATNRTPGNWIAIQDVENHRVVSVIPSTFSMVNYFGVLAWSPDSTRLAVGNDEGFGVYALDGRKLWHSGPNRKLFGSGAWSPDGKWIAGIEESSRQCRLWHVDGTPGPIISDEFEHLSGDRLPMSWRFDSTQLAVMRPAGPRGHLSVYDLDGSFVRTIVTLDRPNTGWPRLSWSPDGEILVLESGTTQFMLFRVDGNHIKTIDGLANDGWSGWHDLAWNPSGSRFIARSKVYLADGTLVRSGIPYPAELRWTSDTTCRTVQEYLNGHEIHEVRGDEPPRLLLKQPGQITPTMWKTEGCAVAFSDETVIRFTSAGQILRKPMGIDQCIWYVVQQPGGHWVPLNSKQFHERIGLDADRQVVQWALDIGGAIRIESKDTWKIRGDFDSVNDLPTLGKIVEMRFETNRYLVSESVDHMKRFQDLRRLDLQSSPVPTEFLTAAFGLPNLGELDLHRAILPAKLSESLESAIGANQSLEVLDLRETEVNDSWVPALSRIKSLKKILVQGTKISAEAAKSLPQDR
jgi:serine/threonine protein kinase/WD40 repeat protein